MSVVLAVMLIGCTEEAQVDPAETAEAVATETATPAEVKPVEAPAPVEVIKPAPVVVEPKPAPKPEPVPAVKPKEVVIPKPPAAAVEDGVAVTVNGQAIMLSAVDELIQPQLENMKKMQQEPTEEIMNNLRKRPLGRMVQEAVIDAKIKANGIVTTDEEVEAKLEEIAKQQKKTVAELIASAPPQYTEEKIRKQVKTGISFEKLIDIEAGESVAAMTDEEAKKFYDENIARFSSPDEVKTSHIITGGRGFDSFDEEKKTAAKLKIEEVKKKLDAGGNFEELAKEFSEGPSAGKGGDLDVYISVDGKVNGRPTMDKTYSAAAHTVDIGGVTDIVKTPFGYHIIKCTDKKAAEVKTFEEVKDAIIAQQKQMKMRPFVQSYMKKLMDDAEIVYAKGLEPTPRPQPKPRPRVEVKPPAAPTPAAPAPAEK